MPTASIISKNKELVRFFELELSVCGYTALENKGDIFSNSVPDVVFADTDTVSANSISDFICPIVYISSEYAEKKDGNDLCLTWPTDISDIRRALLLASGAAQSDIPLVTKEPSHTDAIYVLDRERFVVALGEKHIKLTKNEFLILRELCSASPAILGREKIKNILGADTGNISDVYICNLRKKLESPTGKRIIFTHRGEGYRTELKLID